MLFTMMGDWFNNTMAFLFVKLFDTMAYGLLSVTYNIFYAVSRLDLFGGSAAGAQLYNTITSRFYNILSVIMIFVFAYQLIMMIIDPDGKDKKATGSMVKDTLVSIIFIILCPTIFRYMSLFQNHVIENNTIGSIILGTNGGSNDNVGKNVSLMVFMSFYHPVNTTYNTFFDENGELRSDAISLCEDLADDHSTCKKFYEGLEDWRDDDSTGVGSITKIKTLRHRVGDEMEYMFILSTAGGLFTAWFFLAYSIAMGTRAVKLGVLQLISPIPLVLRIFPQTRKSYETWFGELKKAYLEVFIRLAVIFFIVALIQLVPTFIEIIFDANNNAGDGLTKALATVCLILGLLQFAKDAPDLFKTLFSNGGNLLSGLNFSPKVRSHVESNPYAMKAIGAGVGAAGGLIGTMGKAGAEAYKNSGSNGKTASLLRAGAAALGAAPRGLIKGGVNGLKNAPDKITAKNYLNAANQGLMAGQDSWDKRGFQETRKNFSNFLDRLDPNSGQTLKDNLGQLVSDQIGTAGKWGSEVREANKERFQNFGDSVLGQKRDYNTAAQSARTVTDTANSMIERAEGNDKVKERRTAIAGEVNAGRSYQHTDGKTYRNMYKTLNDIKGVVGSPVDIGGGLQEVMTSDGMKYVIDTNGASEPGKAKVLSARDCKAEVALSQAQTAIGNGQNVTYNGTTYGNTASAITDLSTAVVSTSQVSGATTVTLNNGQVLTQDVNSSGQVVMMDSSGNVQYTVTSNTTNTNGEQVRVIENAQTNTTSTETVRTDGSKQIVEVSASGDRTITYEIDSSGNVTSKQEVSVSSTGETTTKIIENVENLISSLQNQAASNQAETIYNVQQVYDELDEQEVANIAKEMQSNTEARVTNAATMLKQLQDNANQFSSAFQTESQEEFVDKFNGETMEHFLERMAKNTTTTVTSEDAKKLKAIKKLMSRENKRSQATADALQKEREAREAANKKNDSKK